MFAHNEMIKPEVIRHCPMTSIIFFAGTNLTLEVHSYTTTHLQHTTVGCHAQNIRCYWCWDKGELPNIMSSVIMLYVCI